MLSTIMVIVLFPKLCCSRCVVLCEMKLGVASAPFKYQFHPGEIMQKRIRAFANSRCIVHPVTRLQVSSSCGAGFPLSLGVRFPTSRFINDAACCLNVIFR
ncbi:uncharacterized protein EDB91DRAFT_1166214 [Suillus paluster]|uniref:uncharacterized protein n=1 Tax=Suillus paluster TaxID=48578 RepID=UPI001B85DB42|nr:uncharacterized protein EDB91DRAFT_1166214 [Suillus paluster]KAG1726540.1 hypothetical protein EDB91DRAFT_1166214 [Suillus paluster]